MGKRFTLSSTVYDSVQSVLKTTPLTILEPRNEANAKPQVFYNNTAAVSEWSRHEQQKQQQFIPHQQASTELFIYGFCLILIPTATILGNLLVIVSVLRFKILHSAINFFILGLAVADLLVALFVMPYAVYVYIQGGYWYLGELMCDIYSASDVACSTASILLLAIISFDRYRAVSQPIKYSRQSRNIKRVICILLSIWFFSFALASPIVLGVNYRPANANPYECRFYNPVFSIVSSVGSFVIPCCFILFVYIRIMIALRKREKAAKARRIANMHAERLRDKSTINESSEAGEVVAGPAVNMMMMALPSMSRRIRQFERHKAAIDQAGGDFRQTTKIDESQSGLNPHNRLGNGRGAFSSRVLKKSKKTTPQYRRSLSNGIIGIFKGVNEPKNTVNQHHSYGNDKDELIYDYDEEEEFDFDEEDEDELFYGNCDNHADKPLSNIQNMMQSMTGAANYRNLFQSNIFSPLYAESSNKLRRKTSQNAEHPVLRKRSTRRHKRSINNAPKIDEENGVNTPTTICQAVGSPQRVDDESEELLNFRCDELQNRPMFCVGESETCNSLKCSEEMLAKCLDENVVIKCSEKRIFSDFQLSTKNVQEEEKNQALLTPNFARINKTPCYTRAHSLANLSARAHIRFHSCPNILFSSNTQDYFTNFLKFVPDNVYSSTISCLNLMRSTTFESLEWEKFFLNITLKLLANLAAKYNNITNQWRLPRSLSLVEISDAVSAKNRTPNECTFSSALFFPLYVRALRFNKRISTFYSQRSLSFPFVAQHEHDLMLSSSPCSSADSLSDNLNVVTNDFVSELPTNASRCSSDADFSSKRYYRSFKKDSMFADGATSVQFAHSTTPKQSTNKTNFGRLKRSMRKRAKRAFTGASPTPNHGTFAQPRVQLAVPPECLLPAIFSRLSRYGGPLFRRSLTAKISFGILNRGTRQSDEPDCKFNEGCATSSTTRAGTEHQRDIGFTLPVKRKSNCALTAARPAIFCGYSTIAASNIVQKNNGRYRTSSVKDVHNCLNSLAFKNKGNALSEGAKATSTAESMDVVVIRNAGAAEDKDEKNSNEIRTTFSPLLEEVLADDGVNHLPPRMPLLFISNGAAKKSQANSINVALAPLAQHETDSPLMKLNYSEEEALLSQAQKHSLIKNDSLAAEFFAEGLAKNSAETSSTTILRSSHSSIMNSDAATKPLLDEESEPSNEYQQLKAIARNAQEPATKITTALTTTITKPAMPNNAMVLKQQENHQQQPASRPLRHSVDSITYNRGAIRKSTGSFEYARNRFFERNHSSDCACALATLHAAGGKRSSAGISTATKALAVKMVKKSTNRKESSLKRKVTKAQRKEKRATKTLGIVVGIFLVCWVPFFTINILNAVCVTVGVRACEVGFAPFFYATWIGYMNSFMNPIIYTIFNTEFRRAFKSLILGKNAVKRRVNAKI